MEGKGESHGTSAKSGVSDEKSAFLSWFSQLNEKCPNDSLLFIVNNRTAFLSILQEKNTNDDTMSSAIITLGKACNADNHHQKTLNKLMINLSLSMCHIVNNFTKYLLLLKKLQILKYHHFDALLYLAKFLKTFQLILPSYSSYSMSMLLLSLESTCDSVLKNQKEFLINHIGIRQILKLFKDKQKHFSDNFLFNDKEKLSESEKLQLEDPPENFRSLSIIPTVDDIHMTSPFLRPNLVKGRYKSVEHYLDVQFRLLREDYIKPLRDGVAEYRKLKKEGKYFKNCQNVRFYYSAFVHSEEFVDGDLLHKIQFRDEYFSTIIWENSKRFLTGNILCLSMDDFYTMLFATVIQREPKELKQGLLLVKFVEIDGKPLNLVSSMNYVVIELSTLFESYRHNLKALQQLGDNSLPMKNYIVNVEKRVNKPAYLQPTTVFDMRPLLFPLEMGFLISHKIYGEKMHFTHHFKTLLKTDENEWPTSSELKLGEPEYIALKSEKYKTVQVTNESKWPSASELKMDESQYIALKSAITKEFAIIQGPPGTGKTYIGLRIVQLLLHNLNAWFRNESGSMPMLIVCYTNHALDQFLEGISYLTKKIVRFGGRGSNEMIDKFQIKNVVKRARENKSIPRYIGSRIFEARTEIEKIQKKIEYYKTNLYNQSTNRILHEYILEKYIPSVQFTSLTKSNYPVIDKHQNVNGKIYEWLEVDHFIDFQLNIRGYENEPLTYSNGIRGKKSEIAHDSGIEFTKNQRNIEYYDFIHRTILRSISESNKNRGTSHEQEQQYENRKKEQDEYIRNSLGSNPAMKEQWALMVRNVWRLPINERWQLYKFWLNRFLEREKQIYSDLQHCLKNAFEELWNACVERDLWVLEDAQVVGMTTTGASKFRHILEAMNPIVLIVEEAAETLESHIITSLTPKTKHVILIGDQQQLRPSPTVYTLAENYGMNISLFERMIMNEVEYCQLLLQHRMRPEIASLIVPHIYPDLENHEVVTKFENIKGVEKDVFFVTHTFDEQHMEDSKSKTNVHEAKFIIRLCKYLIYQGYEPSQITVLTTYSAQLFVLKKFAADGDVHKVHFTVVDNYQGEENDIVLISFVRSNNEGNIGFLKVSNRVCVALSRAKKGLYCTGNFALLGEKSKLWKNILQTLTTNKFIGPSLRLICQNHPNVFTDVASDSDFNAVPEGGCNRKCEYLLSCGHTCTLLCHPYDPGHENFKCKKPCTKTCEKGHPCQMKCFNDCKPCPVDVEKVLPTCGHTVNAACGKNITEIECFEPCKKSCKEGHPCPQKCFEICGNCTFMVNKILPKCMHTMKAACWESAECITCENQCNKTCPRNHLCQKKCFETCGPCEVIIEKELNCGHTVKAPCGMKENEIICTSACKKLLPCSHECKNKCHELCEKKCVELVESRSSICGHSFSVECGFVHDSVEISKRCPEPCEKVLPCGHMCKGTCSACKQGNEHIVCNETCQKPLLCGHLCTNKCSKPCVVICKKSIKITSLVCSHLLNIECYLADNLNELSKKCLNPCKEILPCGHICRGNCGCCYQGRLHVSCSEPCNKTLICGHKCKSKCFMSCPPCTEPCENRCTHKKCPNKCGDPCVKCVKPCNWSCSHKKCTRRCSELCNRNPCNEKCLKKLPCNHPCVGFCGEPCPRQCDMCSENTFKENSSTLTNDEKFGYIYLEDCQHTLKEDDLRRSLTSNSSGLQKLELKTCPQCGTIIRKNLRFSKVIKSCISDLEKIKQMTKYNKDKNLNLQRNLLKYINESHSSINDIYKSVIKVLSGGHVTDTYQLANLESIINIAKEIELNHYGSSSMFALTPFIEKLIAYMQFCRTWMIDFIGKNFLTVSEYQLQQLSKEAYRMSLLSFLLKYAKQKHFASLSPKFEKCASTLINFSSLSDENVEYFNRHIKSFVINLNDVPTKNSYPQEVVNMSALWYRCSKGHIICLSNNFEASERRDCYKCRKVVDNGQCLKSSKTPVDVENYSKSDEFDVEEALDESKEIADNNTLKQTEKFLEIDERNPTITKMGHVGKKTVISDEHNQRFQRKLRPHVEFPRKSRISNVPECGYSIDNTFRKSFGTNDDYRHSYLTRAFKKPILKCSQSLFREAMMDLNKDLVTSEDISGRNFEKSGDEELLNPTRTFNKPTSKDNESRKKTEVKDHEKLSHITKALSELSINKDNFGMNSKKSSD